MRGTCFSRCSESDGCLQAFSQEWSCDRSIDYAEERRLFYVAMTRTKNRVFFVAPEANPSEFLLELKQTYKNVKLLGDWNEEEPVSIAKKPCPLCGYPMRDKM